MRVPGCEFRVLADNFADIRRLYFGTIENRADRPRLVSQKQERKALKNTHCLSRKAASLGVLAF